MTSPETDSSVHRFTAPEDAVGDRLDRFLGRQLYPSYSRSYLSQLIRDGRVLVNQQMVDRPSHRLELDDQIEATLGPPPSQTPQAEDLPLNVIYEDQDLVVINKPAGLLVHPVGPYQGGTLVNALLHHYPEIETVGVVHRPGIVHRLDRLTSGVMVVARSNRARSGLVGQFKERLVKKEYRAIVVGKMSLISDYIDLPIGTDPKHHERMRIDLTEGKPASTFYEVEERFPGFTAVKAFPLSGRTHQIRIHLAQLGHPVVMDPIYGKSVGTAYTRFRQKREKEGKRVPSIRRQALHAHRLRFVHPVDGRTMEWESPIPADIEELGAALRED